MLHPRGLVPKLLGLWFQFRGDRFKRIASFTSESDSKHLEAASGHTTKFFSLTTDMNRDSRNPRVPAVQPGSNLKGNALGVRVQYYFCFCLSFNPFRLQTMANLKEGDQWQMWEFIPVD